jgi:hypothetical protein
MNITCFNAPSARVEILRGNKAGVRGSIEGIEYDREGRIKFWLVSPDNNGPRIAVKFGNTKRIWGRKP